MPWKYASFRPAHTNHVRPQRLFTGLLYLSPSLLLCICHQPRSRLPFAQSPCTHTVTFSAASASEAVPLSPRYCLSSPHPMTWGIPPALGAPSGPFSACASSDSPSPRSEMRDPWHLPGLCASHCPALPLGTPSLSWCEHLALGWWSPDHNSASHLSQKFNPRLLEWDVAGLCPGDVHTHLRCGRKVPGFPVFAPQASSPVSLALRVIPAPPPTHLALRPHHFSKSYGFYIISNSNILFPLSYYCYLIPTLAIFHLGLRSGCLTLGAVLTWLTCFTKCLHWWPIRCVTWETKLM